MDKVAIFGNAGAGKSTLARRLSELTGLPLYSIDIMQFPDGRSLPHDQYLKEHAEVLGQEKWIIDGYGCSISIWERLAAADTLIYIDLPLINHYLWVTKRLVKGMFITPEGWPPNSPIWRSSMAGYRVIFLCHRNLTPRYRQYVSEVKTSKEIHHLTSPRQIRAFLKQVSSNQG